MSSYSSEIEIYGAALKTAEEYEKKHNVPNEETAYFFVFPNKIHVYHYFKKIIDASRYLEEIDLHLR